MRKKRLKTIKLDLAPDVREYIVKSAKYVKMTVGDFITLCIKLYFKHTKTDVDVQEFCVLTHKEHRAVRRLRAQNGLNPNY